MYYTAMLTAGLLIGVHWQAVSYIGFSSQLDLPAVVYNFLRHMF